MATAERARLASIRKCMRRSGWQGMMLFLHQFTRELQSRADVFNAQVVFSLYFLEGHASGQAPHNDGDGCARAANDCLAVEDGWVNCNSVIHCSRRLRYTRRLGKKPNWRGTNSGNASGANGSLCGGQLTLSTDLAALATGPEGVSWLTGRFWGNSDL